VAGSRDSATSGAFVSRNRVALRNWVERDRLRPVVVTSPHPQEECLRRLAKVTTGRKSGWYLDSRTATLPDPLFHGEVGPSAIRIMRFHEVNRRNGPSAWFEARPDPALEGGTTLTGTVGLPSGPSRAIGGAALLALLAVGGVVSFVVGVVIAASGHFNGGTGVAIGLPVLIVLSLLAGRGYDRGPGLRKGEDPIPALLRQINDVLDSTSAFPGVGSSGSR
jgi:hypothetical protein